jgi:hypothetical protein
MQFPSSKGIATAADGAYFFAIFNGMAKVSFLEILRFFG